MVVQAALCRYWIRSSREVAGRGGWWLAMGITFVGDRSSIPSLACMKDREGLTIPWYAMPTFIFTALHLDDVCCYVVILGSLCRQDTQHQDCGEGDSSGMVANTSAKKVGCLTLLSVPPGTRASQSFTEISLYFI